MRRLIKTNGVGQDYLNQLEGNEVTVYHGTGAQNYHNIVENGLQDGGGVSYQLVSEMTQDGIWVTLKRDIAYNYAKQSANGYSKNNPDDEYSNYGVIFEFIVSKDNLSDEGSGVMNNFKLNIPVTAEMINSGHAHVINFENGTEYQSF